MNPHLHEEEYVIGTLPHGRSIPHAALGAFHEPEATTIYLTRKAAIDLGIGAETPWALVTLSVHSSLSAIGFLARITHSLAACGISVNPISAFYHDHIFIPWGKREQALSTLRQLQSHHNRSAVIMHGTLGSPHGNWFPWLAQKLSERGYTVTVPQFPSPQGQSLESWLQTLHETDIQFDSNTLLIGHSLGATFLLHILESLPMPVMGTFLVATPLSFIGISEYDSLNRTFLKTDFDWATITRNTPILEICHGSEDPYVPLSQAIELGKYLSKPVTVIPGAKHLSSEDGYYTFEWLDDRIKKFCE